MSLETAAEVALTERARHKEFVEALEARHGKDVAWVIRHHAEMLYLISSSTPPQDMFEDQRLGALVESGRQGLTTLVAEAVNTILIQFVLRRPLEQGEAEAYAKEIQVTLQSLLRSETALLQEMQKP